MSSSTEPRVLRGGAAETLAGLPMPDLRTGRWTRLAGGSVLGDPATERLLGSIAEETRRAAGAQGYAVGWAEGRRAAEAEALAEAEETRRRTAQAEAVREAEHAAAVAALQSAAAQLHDSLSTVCRSVDEQATDLALELTRELVGRVSAATAGGPADLDGPGGPAGAGRHVVERVLGVLPEHPVVRVRLHPSVAALPDVVGDLRDRGVAVVPDAGLGPMDAVAEVDDHVVDLRVTTALTRLAEVLR